METANDAEWLSERAGKRSLGSAYQEEPNRRRRSCKDLKLSPTMHGSQFYLAHCRKNPSPGCARPSISTGKGMHAGACNVRRNEVAQKHGRTPFATIKYRIFGHPRLLMRGLSGARAEIGIATIAYNLKRITTVLGAERNHITHNSGFRKRLRE